LGGGPLSTGDGQITTSVRVGHWIRDVEPTPEGGHLVLLDYSNLSDGSFFQSVDPGDQVKLLAPVSTRYLAVAVLEARGRQLRYRATRPAKVVIELHRRGRRFARISETATAGLNTVALPRQVRPNLYMATARVEAEDSSEAVHRSPVLSGQRLPLNVANWASGRFYNAAGGIYRWGQGAESQPIYGCRRWTAARVDCGYRYDDIDFHRNRSVLTAVVLRRSGHVHVRPYACRRGRTPSDQFRRRPSWLGPGNEVPLGELAYLVDPPKS
jgi:hypothetical protein